MQTENIFGAIRNSRNSFLIDLINREDFNDIIKNFGYVTKSASLNENTPLNLLQKLSRIYVPDNINYSNKNIEIDPNFLAIRDYSITPSKNDFGKVNLICIAHYIKRCINDNNIVYSTLLRLIKTHLVMGPTYDYPETICDVKFLLNLIDFLENHKDFRHYVKPKEYALKKLLYKLVYDTDKTVALASLINACFN